MSWLGAREDWRGGTDGKKSQRKTIHAAESSTKRIGEGREGMEVITKHSPGGLQAVK